MNRFDTPENKGFTAITSKYPANMALVARLEQFRETLDGFAPEECNLALAQSSLSAQIALLLHDLSQCNTIDAEMSLRIKSTYEQMLGFIAGLSQIGRIPPIGSIASEPIDRS